MVASDSPKTHSIDEKIWVREQAAATRKKIKKAHVVFEGESVFVRHELGSSNRCLSLQLNENDCLCRDPHPIEACVLVNALDPVKSD